jgi:hypothetical protein
METQTEQYKIIFDNGKPFEEIVYNEIDLKNKLREFYLLNKDNDNYFNAIVLNEKDEDISESQFIEEIIGDILNEEENEQGFKLNWTNKENALKEIKKQEIFKELNIKEYD